MRLEIHAVEIKTAVPYPILSCSYKEAMNFTFISWFSSLMHYIHPWIYHLKLFFHYEYKKKKSSFLTVTDFLLGRYNWGNNLNVALCTLALCAKGDWFGSIILNRMSSLKPQRSVTVIYFLTINFIVFYSSWCSWFSPTVVKTCFSWNILLLME